MTQSLQSVFGAVLREERSKVGVSQEELAEMADLHRTYVSLLERGARNPSLEVISALATALGISMSTLLERVESHQRGK